MCDLCNEEIAELRARNEKLRIALSDLLKSWSTEDGWMNDDLVADRARAVLEEDSS